MRLGSSKQLRNYNSAPGYKSASGMREHKEKALSFVCPRERSAFQHRPRGLSSASLWRPLPRPLPVRCIRPRRHLQCCQMVKFDLFLSLDCARVEWRVWGRNSRKGRDQILQRSIAEPQSFKPQGPNVYDLKIWQPWLAVLFQRLSVCPGFPRRRQRFVTWVGCVTLVLVYPLRQTGREMSTNIALEC